MPVCGEAHSACPACEWQMWVLQARKAEAGKIEERGSGLGGYWKETGLCLSLSVLLVLVNSLGEERGLPIVSRLGFACVLLNHYGLAFQPTAFTLPLLYSWVGTCRHFSWSVGNVKLCWEKGAFWWVSLIPWLSGQFSQQQQCFLEGLSRTTPRHSFTESSWCLRAPSSAGMWKLPVANGPSGRLLSRPGLMAAFLLMRLDLAWESTSNFFLLWHFVLALEVAGGFLYLMHYGFYLYLFLLVVNPLLKR